jgi:diguanylate cyclase (GGDEF)-like protein/PAS domain S-box-containing protein
MFIAGSAEGRRAVTVTSSAPRTIPVAASVEARAEELLHQQRLRIWTQTDRLFAALFILQWVAGIAAALWLAPYTWSGRRSTIHLHVWAAVYLGAIVALFPTALAIMRPGRASTRHVIAVAQMTVSGLLIQLTGGRIETHFHVFGSLAFLSFYRDWRVLVPATIVVATDHFLRGWFWPQSVFGVLAASQWRWVEHAGWVIFENIFLTVACVRSQREMRAVAERSAALEASEEQYRSIMEQAAEGICLLDPDTLQVLERNRAYSRLLSDADAPAAIRDAITNLLASAPATTSATPHDCQIARGDGSVLDLSVTVSRITFGSREVLCVSIRDVTERRRAQEALRQSEERYVRAARGANDGLWDWDLTTGEIYFSPRWKQMLGLTDDDNGSLDRWLKLIHIDDHLAFLGALRAHLDGRSDYLEHEHRMLHSDGEYRWMLCRGLAVRDENGNASRMAGSQTDVTERHESDDKLRHAALHDSLTGLPNRALFTALLERAVSRKERHPEYRFAVLFVDVDGFKTINDGLGHLAGDQLLRSIAVRIHTAMRGGDVVARFGGDEFTLLVDDMEDQDDVMLVASRIQDSLRAPFAIGPHEITITVSIGIAVAASPSETGEDLLRDADHAMYHAKALGKNRSELSVSTVRSRQPAAANLATEADLRRALDRSEFVLHYQPILALRSQRIVGFEALVRWQRSDGTLIAPGQFIPTAEQTGLIVPLGAWALSEACRQMSAWQQEFRCPWLTIAVNISPMQLEDPNFVNQVASAMALTGLAPNTLHLEITENALMDRSDDMLGRLRHLKQQSVRLYLDDFGVGYSSLGYLHRFPVDMIKIDRSFVRRMESEKSNTVVETIIALAKKLEIGVIAEGVETYAQLELLKATDCEQVQGYLFSPPVEPASVILERSANAGPRVAIRSRRQWMRRSAIGA